MDDDFQSHGWIFACLPSCFRHCFRRWTGTLGPGHIDPERQPLFPPPSTILTPPRPRPNLPSLSGLNLAQTNAPWSAHINNTGDRPNSPSLALGTGRPSGPPTPLLSEADRMKMDSISKAFAGRMKPLRPNSSLPPTPTSAQHPAIRPLSSMQGIQLHTSSTSALNTKNRTNENDDRPSPNPIRPSVPNLGRSSSEPRNLADLGGFAPHQVPPGHQVFIGAEGGSGSGGRGRGGRSRSATTLEGMRGRGRSPGPYLEGFTRTDPSASASNAREGEMGRSKSHPRLSALINSETVPEPAAAEEEEEARGVVRKELGLKGLYNVTSSSSSVHSAASAHASGSVRRGKSRIRGQRTARGMRRVMTG